jgi:hypothetical protein
MVRTNTTVAPNAPPPERAAEVTPPPPLRTRIPVTSATITPVRTAIIASAVLMPFGPIFLLPNNSRRYLNLGGGYTRRLVTDTKLGS